MHLHDAPGELLCGSPAAALIGPDFCPSTGLGFGMKAGLCTGLTASDCIVATTKTRLPGKTGSRGARGTSRDIVCLVDRTSGGEY